MFYQFLVVHNLIKSLMAANTNFGLEVKAINSTYGLTIINGEVSAQDLGSAQKEIYPDGSLHPHNPNNWPLA